MSDQRAQLKSYESTWFCFGEIGAGRDQRQLVEAAGRERRGRLGVQNRLLGILLADDRVAAGVVPAGHVERLERVRVGGLGNVVREPDRPRVVERADDVAHHRHAILRQPVRGRPCR